MDEKEGEMIVPAMSCSPAIQVMARVLSTVIELLAIEATIETMGEAGKHMGDTTFALALPKVARPWRVLLMVTGGSNNNQLHDSPPCTGKMLDLLPRRLVDVSSRACK